MSAHRLKALIAHAIFKSDAFILLISLIQSYFFNGWKNDVTSVQAFRYENCFPSGETRAEHLPVLLKRGGQAYKRKRSESLDESSLSLCSECNGEDHDSSEPMHSADRDS